MHLSFFALRHFSYALNTLLKESTFINAFSFSKEEIIFSFLSPNNLEIFLSAHLVNKSCYFQVHDQYNRPKRNFLYQFEAANGGIVESVIQSNFDRSFYIQLKTGMKLLFKMHGGFSNVLLIDNEEDVLEIFRKEFTLDSDLKLGSLSKQFDWELVAQATVSSYKELRSLMPLFDEHCLRFMESSSFLQMNPADRKSFISKYFIESPNPLYLKTDSAKSYLSIFPEAGLTRYEAITEAYTRLARLVLPSYQMEVQKRDIRGQLDEKLKKTKKQLFSAQKHLENAESFIGYENTGHIIMANMHAIPKLISSIELLDFYTEKMTPIKLDKNLSPQENAEKYYRKSKALKQDIPNLKNQVIQLINEQSKLENMIAQFSIIEQIKELKAFAVQNGLQKLKEDEPIFPFRKMMVDDFEVWIGKNASNNDLLTFGYAHKNDIWMHAKDVSGSHLIIKNQSGKIIMKPTIEKAGSIAAFYSKSKSQTLAAVTYTQRKFVVKAKGRNPGAVHLLSEQTILVTPKLPS